MESLRIDQWLWMARFFKSRSLARKAVTAGHVQLSDRRVKPATPVQAGDQIELRRGREQLVVVVQDIPRRRGPASEAADLYEETEASQQRREQDREQRRFLRDNRDPERRPDKRDRRRLAALKRSGD